MRKLSLELVRPHHQRRFLPHLSSPLCKMEQGVRDPISSKQKGTFIVTLYLTHKEKRALNTPRGVREGKRP